jgi:hypothetical protein
MSSHLGGPVALTVWAFGAAAVQIIPQISMSTRPPSSLCVDFPSLSFSIPVLPLFAIPPAQAKWASNFLQPSFNSQLCKLLNPDLNHQTKKSHPARFSNVKHG